MALTIPRRRAAMWNGQGFSYELITAKFFTKEPGTHTNATDAPRTPTALHTHRERRRRGLGPLAANGAAGRRGCGAEGTLLECCDLAEDRFRVPHNRGLDHLLGVVPQEAPRATAELAVARAINRAVALGARRQVAEVRFV